MCAQTGKTERARMSQEDVLVGEETGISILAQAVSKLATTVATQAAVIDDLRRHTGLDKDAENILPSSQVPYVPLGTA